MERDPVIYCANTCYYVYRNMQSGYTRVTLGYWLDIPFVFQRNNWDVDIVSIFGKMLGS